MINFNGSSLTHQARLGNMKGSRGQNTSLDIVKRKEEIEADFTAGEYRKSFTLQPRTKKLLTQNCLC